MRVNTLHPHRTSDGELAITVQMVDGDGNITPYQHIISLAEAAWINRTLAAMIYEETSR